MGDSNNRNRNCFTFCIGNSSRSIGVPAPDQKKNAGNVGPCLFCFITALSYCADTNRYRRSRKMKSVGVSAHESSDPKLIKFQWQPQNGPKHCAQSTALRSLLLRAFSFRDDERQGKKETEKRKKNEQKERKKIRERNNGRKDGKYCMRETIKRDERKEQRNKKKSEERKMETK